jgi:hypothetical protein
MTIEGEIYLGITDDEDLISTRAKDVVREFENFGRSQRTFGGRLKEDVTSRKYTFTINWQYIDSATLDIILEKQALNADLNLRMYITDSTYFTNFDGNCPIVRIRPFSTTDFITGRTTKIYRDAPIVFVEV